MSAALYAIRLMWHGGRGDMGCSGIHVTLREMPGVLRTLGVVELEYVPEVHVMRARETADRWRDMTVAECATVRAWLILKAEAVRAALQESQ